MKKETGTLIIHELVNKIKSPMKITILSLKIKYIMLWKEKER